MPDTHRLRDRTPRHASHRALLFAAAVLALATAGCHRENPVLVQTEKVRRRNLTELVMAAARSQEMGERLSAMGGEIRPRGRAAER